MSFLDDLADDLDRRRQRHLLRAIRPTEWIRGAQIGWNGRAVINMCHNDYLGLSREPRVIEAACKAAQEWGTGSAASRLITGSPQIVSDLESELAGFKRADAALAFPTGYQASIGVLGTLPNKDDIIWLDRLTHSCLVEGTRLSGARIRVFPHNNVERLAELLARTPCKGRHWIVADGVTSMDGDIAPLPDLLGLARRHDAVVVIDDAHGTGVVGATGRGTAEYHEIDPRAHSDHLIMISTLSKALGAQGGVVTGASIVREALVNRAHSQIYTTGLAPTSAAAAMAALDILKDDPPRVQRLRQRARATRKALQEAGLDTMTSKTAIIPIRMSGEAQALEASRKLEENGLLVIAIRPPTVPRNTSRLRMTANMLLTDEEHDNAVDTIIRVCGKRPREA